MESMQLGKYIGTGLVCGTALILQGYNALSDINFSIDDIGFAGVVGLSGFIAYGLRREAIEAREVTEIKEIKSLKTNNELEEMFE